MKLIDLDKVDFSAEGAGHPMTGVIMETFKESLYKEPEVKAIPLEVIEGYLDGLLQEWDRLGDRKYDRANMQIYNHVRSMMDDLQEYCDKEFKPTLDAQIQSAEVKAKVSENTEREVCLVNFRRVYGVGLGEFNVKLDIMPEEYLQGKKDFSLNADERILAYDNAAEVVGENDLSDFVIFSAEMVIAPKERSKDCFGER